MSQYEHIYIKYWKYSQLWFLLWFTLIRMSQAILVSLYVFVSMAVLWWGLKCYWIPPRNVWCMCCFFFLLSLGDNRIWFVTHQNINRTTMIGSLKAAGTHFPEQTFSKNVETLFQIIYYDYGFVRGPYALQTFWKRKNK